MLTKIKKKYLEFRHRNCYDHPCAICAASIVKFWDALIEMKYDTALLDAERKRDSDG